jgi:hypothetical protein
LADFSIEDWGFGSTVRFDLSSKDFVHLAVSDKQGGLTWVPIEEVNGVNQPPCIYKEDRSDCADSTDTLDSTTVVARNLGDDDPVCGDPCFKFLLSTDIRDPETFDDRDSPHGILYRWTIDGDLYSTLPEPSYFVATGGNHDISLSFTDLDSNQWHEQCYQLSINMVEGIPADTTLERQACGS